MGMVVVFAPSGIGVREAVLFLASRIIPQHEALVLAFMARFRMIAVEVVLALAAYITRRWWAFQIQLARSHGS
jgi:hypothetical protein